MDGERGRNMHKDGDYIGALGCPCESLSDSTDVNGLSQSQPDEVVQAISALPRGLVVQALQSPTRTSSANDPGSAPASAAS